MNLAIDRLKGWITRRPASTEGHTETARETGVALGLMAQAADAAEPTPEQQIFLSQSEHGMRERLSMLLGIPHRSLAQEREKLAIEQWLSRDNNHPPGNNDHPQGNTGGVIPQRFLGAIAAGPWSLLLTPWTLVVAGIAAFLAQGAWLKHVAHERDELRGQVTSLEHSRDAYAHALGQERAAHANDVAHVLEDTAQTVEQMRRADLRRRQREERERSRHEDLANGSVNFGERLRELARPADAGLPTPPATAPSSDPAGPVSTAPVATPDAGDPR